MNKIKSKFTKSIIGALIVGSTVAVTPATATAQIPFSLFSSETPSLAPMLEKVTPAVVRISVAGNKEVRRQVPDIFRFFGQRRGPQQYKEERPFTGLGSGVIIDASEGYIVTNHHVIADADKIKVTLKDGREFDAKKIGDDADSDIAILQIEAKDLTDIKIADSDKLRVGDFAIAIGNPFGLTQTVTSGIISALGRSGLNIEGYEDFIQTDAAINSGNSGGALVDLNGNLIGINTAIYGPNGGNVGIGFAIPSNMMQSLVGQILEFGEVRRGVLGVRGGELSSDIAEAMGLDIAQGAFINEVLEDSSAKEAGIKSGDVITSVNGVKIKTFAELASKIGTLGAGKKVAIGIFRDGKELELDVTLKESSGAKIEAENLHEMLTGASLTNGQSKTGLDGVEITAVEERSPAARLGLEEGDVITGVNRRRVEDMGDLRTILKEIKSGAIAIQIQRGRQDLYLLIR